MSTNQNFRKRSRLAERVGGRVRGSVILVVLITLTFATFALMAFMERASNDLLVEKRAYDAARLRLEAHSALETTLAVLADFYTINGALRSPSEGWEDPLTWAGYEPREGCVVEVSFIDESGKFSLPNASQVTLVNLFKDWGLSQPEAVLLADAILGWMKKDYVPTSAGAPDKDDYEREEIPFDPPGRPLRSFNELATVAVARDVFYDEKGQPNELWRRFVDAFSLYNYMTPSINGASSELLAGLGGGDSVQKKKLQDYLHGTGAYQGRGPGYFKAASDASAVLGPQAPTGQFDVKISALRIFLTVREGQSTFRINTVIAPPDGATIPVVEAAPTAEAGKSGEPATPAGQNAAAPQVTKKLNYPFTILEFRENDERVLPATTTTSS